MAEFNYDSSTSVAYGNSANVKYVLGVSEDGTPVLLQWNSTTGAKAQIDDKLSKAGGSIGNLVVTGITVNGNAVVNGGLNVSNNIDTKTLKVSTRAAIGEDFGSSPTYALKVRGETQMKTTGGTAYSIYNGSTLRAEWSTSSDQDGLRIYSETGAKLTGILNPSGLTLRTYGRMNAPLTISHQSEDPSNPSPESLLSYSNGKLMIAVPKGVSFTNVPQIAVGYTNANAPWIFNQLQDGLILSPSKTGHQVIEFYDKRAGMLMTGFDFTSSDNHTKQKAIPKYYIASSDDRLKTKTGDIEVTLDDLKELSIFNYYLTSDESKTPQIGMSAQEIQKLFPTLVKPIGKTPEGDDYLGLDYARLSVVSMAAVKLLSKELDSVKDRLSKIETKLGI